ncbi:hypothetical protein A2955_01285 [Candidatus Woesebacteria bacterium RIFCSPLOWO2_01_FULL_37_19]|uniref:Glycosyltransferase RgtA/B/C/D-like domain-containing protein n=2 Tax=Candidatus Woeseibacteriota TaxID=1752722 RepID=A0A1F8B2T9_9BACT|nr:MAG: hypothetical protein A2771_02220 [Candidatus Woesebacteria bacterium RIFCSPHIGHO2_01_FULL_38_26b]OGM58059.1 MAG: hypothetical protein A2955_01285 [Candidatus Woesebacteria bacterium RIFCSPLOWO2_01_FULL_37_19]
MKKYYSVFILSLIIFIGFLLRIFMLSSVPSGFFADEASIGVNAYSLLTTGKDEYGVSAPIFFKSFGDYRLPVPIYSNILFIALFGLNEFSVRFTAAFFGTLTIILIYLITKELFKSETAAIFSAFFLAISPWHIHFSRFGSEYIYFPFWFCLSLYLFLVAFKKPIFYILSFFSFGVSIYTYYPSIFITPSFLIFLIALFFKNISKKRTIFTFSVLTFLVILIPLFNGLSEGVVQSRWQKVSVFKEVSLSQSIYRISKTYLAHFSPNFLFIGGDIGYPGHFITRFSVKGLGELYWIQALLIILGIILLWKRAKLRKVGLILLTWFILYPLGSSLTGTDGGGPFSFRSIFGVISFQILTALGVFFLIEIKPRLISASLLLLIVFISILSLSNYAYKYFFEYPMYSSNFWGWQFGPRDIMGYFLTKRDIYTEMYLETKFNSGQIFLKFYDPENVCQNRCMMGDWNMYSPSKKQLFAISYESMQDIPPNLYFDLQKIIFYPDSTPAFMIGELKDRHEQRS